MQSRVIVVKHLEYTVSGHMKHFPTIAIFTCHHKIHLTNHTSSPMYRLLAAQIHNYF